jgi:DNA-binding transcriptional regulator YhcF (GntR family)
MLVAAFAPILATHYGWRAGVLAVAVFSLLLALALQPLRAALDADRGAPGPLRPWQDAKSSLSILRDDARIRSLTFAACGFGIAQFCFGSFFVVWQVEVLGVPLAQAGLALAIGQGLVVLQALQVAKGCAPRPALAVVAAVAVGELGAGAKLPTVRALAAELGLAVNTVARTYRELEADGVIETRGRAGSFVAPQGDAGQQQAQVAAREFVERARRLGLDDSAALDLVRAAQRG